VTGESISFMIVGDTILIKIGSSLELMCFGAFGKESYFLGSVLYMSRLSRMFTLCFSSSGLESFI
jgi:hypothetical protein